MIHVLWLWTERRTIVLSLAYLGNAHVQNITSPPEGVARYCFHPVCLSVCLANILVFYFSAIRRDIDLKFIQDTYRVLLNSLS